MLSGNPNRIKPKFAAKLVILFNLYTKLKYPIFEPVKHRISKVIVILGLLTVFVGCLEKKPAVIKTEEPKGSGVRHAQGFTISTTGQYPVITVTNPWPNSEKAFTYAFIPKEKLPVITYPKDAYDAVIATPISSLVVTSTTHIPALESLNGLSKLVGFPDTKYVSSMPARKRIATGKIKELGNNESLNTEMVIALQPDVVVAFAINNDNNSYDLLQKAGVPILFNGDWTETTPLGKAEWIKFFGVLLGAEKAANDTFERIENDYLEVKELAKQATAKPKVLSGALYKDVWYLPAGESWAAQFMEDANTNYLWADTNGTGSLSLSLEAALEKGQEAEFWISPGQYTSYQQLDAANSLYQKFEAYNKKNVYGFAGTTGPTGGLLYYELAPQRPDLVLKDLVSIFHKELLPDYIPYFFKPLE